MDLPAAVAAPKTVGTVGKRKSAKKKSKKPIFYINLTHCKYDILRTCIEEKGWVECSDDDGVDWVIFWTDTSVSPQRVMLLEKYQKINHFPGMLSIARKAQLAINLRRLQAIFPKEYNFFPETWVLPQDTKEFRNQFSDKTGKSKHTFIIKPDAACQGKGIFLTRQLEHLNKMEEGIKYVAQKYCASPFLIDGYKFDLRIYVLVLSCDPLRIFLYNDGLVRLCTTKYVAPTEKNLKKTKMHLTNYAINKSSENFEKNTGTDKTGVGSKRTIKWFRQHLQEEGYDDNKMWDDVADIVNKTIISTQPNLAHMYHSCFMDPDDDGFSCFEILGLDILFTSKLKPVLIEVNHSPSFTTDSPLDLSIKHGLIKETLKLVNASRYDQSRYRKRVAALAQSRLYGGGDKSRLRKIDKDDRNKIALRIAHEKKVMKNFARIFPPVPPDPASYIETKTAGEGATEQSESSVMTNEISENTENKTVHLSGCCEAKVGGEKTEEHQAADLYQAKLDRHFQKVNAYRRFFVAANDLFETVAVGPSNLRKSTTWRDVPSRQRQWTAAIAARAEGIRECSGEDIGVNDNCETSLDIRRQIRHKRYLEQKKGTKTFSIVTLNQESEAQNIPMRTWSEQSVTVRKPMLHSPPSRSRGKREIRNSSKEKLMGRSPTIVERAEKLTVEDYFREARDYVPKGEEKKPPPAARGYSRIGSSGGGLKQNLSQSKVIEIVRPKTTNPVAFVKMNKIKRDEMISGTKLNLNDHGVDPDTLFGSFVNYRYQQRERESLEQEVKFKKEREIAEIRKKKNKVKRAKSSSGISSVFNCKNNAKLRKTTIDASTMLGVKRGGMVGHSKKRSIVL